MARSTRLRPGVVRLPVAEVAALVRIMNDPSSSAIHVGVRRRVVNQVCRKLTRAISNQIDGEVELDSSTVRLVLQAMIEEVEWVQDLLDDYFDGEEHT